MDNLHTLESRMMRDIDEYVRTLDSFETTLNERNTHWNDRIKLSRKLAAARNKTFNLIISAVIAGIALFLIVTLLLMH